MRVDFDGSLATDEGGANHGANNQRNEDSKHDALLPGAGCYVGIH